MNTALLGLLLALAPGRAQQADARVELEDARSEEHGVLGQLDQIDRELDGVRGELERLRRQDAELETSRRRHEDEAIAAQARLDRHRSQVAAQLAALYQLQRRGLARLVFGAEEPAELRRMGQYLRAIIDADSERLQTWRGALASRQQSVAAADADLAALGALRAELQLKEADLRDRRSRRVQLLDEVRQRRELALRALSEQGQAQQQLGDRFTSTGTIAPEATGSFRESFGKLPWPTTGRLVRHFGPYQSSLTGQQAESMGIDVAADFGTPIRAVFGGTVTMVDFVKGYGQTVAVQHGPYVTIYAHANGVRVRRGEQVQQGQILALVGNSGLTEASDYLLTFEIRYNGSPQDPLPWLRPL